MLSSSPPGYCQMEKGPIVLAPDGLGPGTRLHNGMDYEAGWRGVPWCRDRRGPGSAPCSPPANAEAPRGTGTGGLGSPRHRASPARITESNQRDRRTDRQTHGFAVQWKGLQEGHPGALVPYSQGLPPCPGTAQGPACLSHGSSAPLALPFLKKPWARCWVFLCMASPSRQWGQAVFWGCPAWKLAVIVQQEAGPAVRGPPWPNLGLVPALELF